MKLKMTSIVLLVFLFMVIIKADASDAGEQRNWQRLRQLILQSQQRNSALFDQAMASGVPASGDQLASNKIPVEVYLSGLSEDELIVHAREWVRNITDDSEDPDIIVWLLLEPLRYRSKKAEVSGPILRIISDITELSQFRAALIEWWGSVSASSDKDDISQEARSMRTQTIDVLLEALNNSRSPDEVRVYALRYIQRILSCQIQELCRELKSLGVLSFPEPVKHDLLACANDKGSSMNDEQREAVRLLFRHQRRMVDGAESLLNKKDVPEEIILNKLNLTLKSAELSSLSVDIKLKIQGMESKIRQMREGKKAK